MMVSSKLLLLGGRARPVFFGVRFLLPAFERIRVPVRAVVSSHEPDGGRGKWYIGKEVSGL